MLGKELEMKKIFIIAAAVAMSLSPKVFAQTTAEVQNINGNIVVNGNTAPDIAVTLTVKNVDNENQLYAVKETLSDSEGNFKFDFVLKDEETAQEVYKYLLSIKGDEVFEKNLSVFSETAVINFTNKIKQGNSEELYELLKNDTDDISSSIGILSDKYRGLEEDVQKKICKAFYEDSGVENIVDILNNEIVLYIAKSADQDAYWKLMGNNFGTENISDFTKQRIEATRNYSNIKEYNDEVKKYEVLNKVNSAKYTQLEGIYKDNESVLMLSDCSEYNKYKNMSTSQKRDVNERTVSALLNNPAKEVEEFLKTFKKIVSETKTTDNNGSGSNSSGSGSGSSRPGGKGSTSNNSSVVVPNTDTVTKPDKFNDVSKDFWAYESIERLAEKKIINGYQDGSFKPNENITRESFVTILVNALGMLDENSQCDFQDVPKESWFYLYVASGYKNGIIGGIAEDTFGTGLYITRQDVAAMIFRTLKAADVNIDENQKFTDDFNIADYAKEAVYYLKDKGVITGRGDGIFDPAGNCTRAECAVMICRVLDII